MAKKIVYADGETKDSYFHLLSCWTGNGAGGFTVQPTIASATRSYTLDLPIGAMIQSITVYA